MKILILAHTFPPFNASGSVRVAKLAEYLYDQGHDIRIISAANLLFPKTLKVRLPAEMVTSVAWRRIEAPIDLLRAARSNKGKETTGWRHTDPLRPSLVKRAVIAYRSLLSFPDPQVGWIRPATRAGDSLLRSWRADLIYSSALPFSSHVVAHRLSAKWQIPWIAEFRDLYSGNPYTDLWSIRATIDKWVERKIVATASAVVSVSGPLTDYLLRLHGKPAATIMNGFDTADLNEAPDMSATYDASKVTLVYTGIIYPGRRDPAVLFEALRRMGDERRQFEVRFYGTNLESVSAQAKAIGVADVVQVNPAVSRMDCLGLQKAADGLLLLLWDSPLEQGVLTGKLFEYAGARRPVLSLGCVGGGAAELIRLERLGVATSDPDLVVAFLRELRRLKAEKGSTRLDRGADALSRAMQFQQLEQFLGSIRLRLPKPRTTESSVPERAI